MSEKINVSAEDGATAAFLSVLALSQALARKGLLTGDDLNEAFATAASMCRANGSEDAARMIEVSVPSSVGIDIIALAEARGETIHRKG
ncbi:hypothetical protein [Sphingobium sp. DC-2]|uniref:hypothetical protein n=1 Tax=Sphingobium sp. DC-2 TaxID=1303256 RepID=UPI0004C3A06A|nr:hypothetical protein [Sphingobium sp. DC-2]